MSPAEPPKPSRSSEPSQLSLPEKMFLLAFHPERGKLVSRHELGFMLRAAALASLVHSGHVRDDGGKATAVRDAKGLDPVLAATLAEVGESGRSWRSLVSRNRRQVFDGVRDSLSDARVVKLEQARALGLVPYTRISPRDTRAIKGVAQDVNRAIRGGQPVSRVDGDVAMLAALADAGQLRLVMGIRDRLKYKDRVAQFAEPIAPVTKALHKAVVSRRAAAASAASSGGGG